jgi:hypothetical protein
MNNTPTDHLNEAIASLQLKRTFELHLLRTQFEATYDSIKPFNIVKSTFLQITQDQEMKSNLTTGLLSVASGYLAKKMLVGPAKGPIRNMLGWALQWTVTGKMAQHASDISTVGVVLRNKYLQWRSNSQS